MAPARDKWVRRFIIPETTRHKRGFTIYKITSVVYLKSSYEEVSKVSVWKRYTDFKKLHSELNALYLRSQIKEKFPLFPKSKYFGRFEAEVIEQRRESALKFLEFIGRHSYLYSSDIFIKFFETSYGGQCLNDCSQSLSSDTSEDDRHAYLNSVSSTDTVSPNPFQNRSKAIQNPSTNSCSILPTFKNINKTEHISEKVCEPKKMQSTKLCGTDSKAGYVQVSEIKSASHLENVKADTSERFIPLINEDPSFHNKNNNCGEHTQNDITDETKSGKDKAVEQPIDNINTDKVVEASNTSVTVHDGSDLPELCSDTSQYILIAAAHMSAAVRHEAIMEYEEAFTQYKMGISSLLFGVQSDTDKLRMEIVNEKIAKYLERAEKLYNRHLNCNISLLSKPVSELQNYKVLKIMRSVMLVKDVRQNCLRVVKAVEKLSASKESISNYILRGQVPYMVHLYAFIETDTTVFLILQHLSRGKLWDFIMLHYKSGDNECDNTICNNTTIEKDSERKLKSNNEMVSKEIPSKEIDCNEAPFESSILTNTNFEIQVENYRPAGTENHELYVDLPTTHLLEKAQILLQSVNATLKESNSVVNRLCESKHLINYEDNTAALNLKNTISEREKWNVVLADVSEIANEPRRDNKNSMVESTTEKRVINNNSLSVDDTKNTSSQYSTDSSSLSNSYKDLSFCELESTNSSMDNLKSVSTRCPVENKNNGAIHDVSNIYELEKSLKDSCKVDTKSCIMSDNHVSHVGDILLTQSITNNNLDIEQELWTIPENVIRLWAAEILLALEALHQQDVIVYDLKPDNILLDDNGHVQLTYIIPRHDTDLSKHKHKYASPELSMFLPTVPLTPATDIWSFGVILYELIVGNEFQTRHPGIFQSHSIINIPSKLSENARSLLLGILKYHPNERITIPEIKQHPFFEEIDWSNLVNPL